MEWHHLNGFESHNATLVQVLPHIDILLDEFEEKNDKYHVNDILDPMFNSGWVKMDNTTTVPIILLRMCLPLY